MKVSRKSAWNAVLAVLCFGFFHPTKAEARSPPAPEQCDLNMWYLDRTLEGAFSGELIREQLKIKASIEWLIAKKPKDGLISCATLTAFENILSRGGPSQSSVKTGHGDSGDSTPEEMGQASLETAKERTENGDHDRQEDTAGEGNKGNKSHEDKERDGVGRNQQGGNNENTDEDDTRSKQSEKGEENQEATHKQSNDNTDTHTPDKPIKMNEDSASNKENESADIQHDTDTEHENEDSTEIHDEDKDAEVHESGVDKEQKESHFQDGDEQKEDSADGRDIKNQTGTDENASNTENRRTRSEPECPFSSNHQCHHNRQTSTWSDYIFQSTISSINPRSEPECPFSSNHQCHHNRQTSTWSDYIFQSTISSINHSLTSPSFTIFAQCKTHMCSKQKRRKIRLGASRIHCYYYHILDSGHKTRNHTQPEEVTVAQLIRESCRLSHQCSWQCLYGTHNQQCVQHYDLQVNKSETTPTEEDVGDDGSHHTDHTATKSDEEESDDTEPEEMNEEENKSKLQDNSSDETDDDPAHDDEEDRTKKSTDETEVDGTVTGEKQMKQSNSEDKFSKDNLKHTPAENPYFGTEKGHTSRKLNENLEAERTKDMNSEPEESNKIPPEDHGSSSLSEAELLKIEALFQHKVLEQATKIQSLEILIMRLENHILSQKLNEQNGTSHLVHLENQILRIENELLKLNGSYVSLQAENDMLKSRQNTYLALEHKSKENDKLSLPGNTSEYFQLVLKQQEKISVLSELLNNQSSALHKLQSRSDQLEEQNQMLHQIILNQTALISQVMHKLQEVSEQTLRTQQETSHLKSMVDLQSASSNILHKLEHALQDSSNTRNPPVRNTHDQQSSDQRDSSFSHLQEETLSQVLKFLRPFPDYSSNLQQQICKTGERSRVCLYFSLLISPCPPFRTLSWGKCQQMLSVIGPTRGAKRNTIHSDSFNTHAKVSSTFSETIHADTRMNTNPDNHPAQPEKAQSPQESRSQDDENSDVLSKGDDHTTHRTEQKADEEKEAADSVDIPKVKSVSKESEIKPETPDQKKAKSTDKRPLADMGPLPVKAEDTKEPETTNKQKEDKGKKSERDGDRLGGNEAKKLDTSKKTEKQEKTTERDSKAKDEEDAKDKSLKPETNKENNAKTNSESQDTRDSKDETAKADKDTVDKVIAMDKQSSGPDNPSSSKDSKKQQADEKTADGIKMETMAPSSTNGVSRKGGLSEEDKKRKEEAEKALKLKQEAEALQKKIQEAESRRLAYWNPDNKKPKDCYDLYQRAPPGQGHLRNGAYKVYVRGLNLYVSVYCDMKAGGWTVLMRREDGTLDFYRDWEEYKDGFGTPFGEHYLGNEAIHYLTNQDHYSLQVDLKDWAGHSKTATYTHFWLEDEDNKFQLRILGYSGAAGDGLGRHDGMRFSTRDRDHDLLGEGQMGGSCARRFHGAGWYYKCYSSNLLGVHYEGGAVPDKRFDGIAWKPWTGPSYSLKEVVLKVRPKKAG